MNRRTLLAALAAGGAGLAGCLEVPARDADGSREAAGTDRTPRSGDPDDGASADLEPAPVARHGLPQDICTERRSRDPGIYAIDDPSFDADWSGFSFGEHFGRLEASTTVVGVARGGDARAYPVPVLWYHEVVNDDLGGPLLVTYCPLCRSGMVAERRVGGEPTTFLVTGMLWKPPALEVELERDEGGVFGADRSDPDARARRNGNLVLADRATGSYWSQLIARAICGPAAGTDLEIVPAAVTTWEEWRARYPASTVLLPPPHSGTVDPGA